MLPVGPDLCRHRIGPPETMAGCIKFKLIVAVRNKPGNGLRDAAGAMAADIDHLAPVRRIGPAVNSIGIFAGDSPTR